MSAWPGVPGSLIPGPGSHQVVLLPSEMPSLALQHSPALAEGFDGVWVRDGAVFAGQLGQVV